MILQRLGIVALLAVCGYTGYYLLTQHYWEAEIQVAPDAEKPLFTADNINSTTYNMQGIRTYRIESVHVENYQQLDETHFNEPVLWTYSNGEEEEWRVSSEFAVLEDTKTLVMTGRVRIFNLLPDAQIKVVTTEELTLDLVTRDFWSDTETEITGVGLQTRGERVKGNFGSHQMELIDQVKSRYEQQKN
ncbi:MULTISPECIES: LPS export ABC transporter periplasmic protein LptC [Grimontia]|uniref:Lipopolysaccharide export system protein LptC n=1 Tax=Grimontia marina TaxID=646534 RepID=A0A128EWJ4_9GAMM|nr:MULTISPECIES: LPS export ABC transporter periplasmic protein LptC [Grimontia]WRV97024.1 LPS export ABC transporter periplasmic protein LptC [Grimontia sp. NTOU-MAR1]CZF78361.1 Lipopolysaccharide export system protein LptC [Grimontia marina]